jgi:replicative DNA helicase
VRDRGVATRDIATGDLSWDRIVAIEPAGEEEVFDLTVPGPSSWVADGIVSHNSGALEQDADIVLMLWKDKDDTVAGAPRLIHGSVAKNRNGPTGSFSLLFASEQARFFSKAPENETPV